MFQPVYKILLPSDLLSLNYMYDVGRRDIEYATVYVVVLNPNDIGLIIKITLSHVST